MGAAAHGFSCVWRCMNVQKKQCIFLLPRHQHTSQSRINSKFPCCTLSSSSGPVRYTPKHRRPHPDNQTDNLAGSKPHPSGNDRHEPSGSCTEPRRLGAADRDCSVPFGIANEEGDLRRDIFGPEKAPNSTSVQENYREDQLSAKSIFMQREQTVQNVQKNRKKAHSTVQRNTQSLAHENVRADILPASRTLRKREQMVQKNSRLPESTVEGTFRNREQTLQVLAQENNREDILSAYRTLRKREQIVPENSREAHSTVHKGPLRKREQMTQTDNLLHLSGGDSIEAVESFIARAQKVSVARRKNLELQKNTFNTNEHADPCFPEGVGYLVDHDELADLDECGLGTLVGETDGIADETNFGKVVGLRDAVAASNAAQESAKNLAIHYLGMRPYTASQLRKKLQGRNIVPELVEYALYTVQKCGLQSDLAYAETFTRSRWKTGSWGPQRIRLGLKQRGVSDDIISRAIDVVFHEDEYELSGTRPMLEGDGGELDMLNIEAFGLSKSALNHLILQATKQWDRGRNAPNETKARRMILWLKYRGFNGRVIRFVVNTLMQRAKSQD